MKLTKETLKRIIKEELSKVMLKEGQVDFQDVVNKAIKELEDLSYITDGFEKAAMAAKQSAEDDENPLAQFKFVTQVEDTNDDVTFDVAIKLKPLDDDKDLTLEKE